MSLTTLILMIIRRRFLMQASLLAAFLSLVACDSTPPASTTDPQDLTFELVLAGGRVVDPDSGTDAIRNVGIRDGRVAAISDAPLDGEVVLNVGGLVVAPGFIDLHAHGQDPISARLQALDGVTTAVDLESGAFPIRALDEQREGQAVIHYGASVGHMAVRATRFDDLLLGHLATRPPGQALGSRFAYEEAADEDVEAMLELIDDGLRQGGLGIGMGLVYTPGAGRAEILRVFEHAALRKVPIFVHMRGSTDGPLGDVQEMLANAAATGASVHIVHLNSSTDVAAPIALKMIRGARNQGVDVTTEAYPYTAGSTLIQSALFDSWEGRAESEYQKLEWPLTGERLTGKTFKHYREQGGWVIIHSRTEEMNRWITAQPDVMVASDGIPFAHGPAHPRGSGTFARVLGRYVRDEEALTLMEAISKMSLQPAQRLESFTPQMKRKGRVQVGSDADLTVFNPATVLDRSTYSRGDLPSAGIVHVLVAGVAVVRDGEFVEDTYPGQLIRSEVEGL